MCCEQVVDEADIVDSGVCRTGRLYDSCDCRHMTCEITTCCYLCVGARSVDMFVKSGHQGLQLCVVMRGAKVSLDTLLVQPGVSARMTSLALDALSTHGRPPAVIVIT